MDGLTLFSWGALSVVVGLFASSDGRNGVFWGGASLLFSPLITGIVLGLMVITSSEKVVEADLEESGNEGFDSDDHEKKCPMCAEYIKLEARRCKHCGHEMSEEEVAEQIEERKKKVVGQQKKEPLREMSRNENPKRSASTSEAVAIMTVGASIVVGISLLMWFFG